MPKGISRKPIIRVCRVCQTTFSSTATRMLYCNRKCQDKAVFERKRFSVEYRLKNALATCKNRAKAKQIPFDLTIEFLKNLWESQKGLCALTKTPFDFSSSDTAFVAGKHSPSVDRIIPAEGYIPSNVRLITFQCNMAKGHYTDSDLYDLAERLLDGRSRV